MKRTVGPIVACYQDERSALVVQRVQHGADIVTHRVVEVNADPHIGSWWAVRHGGPAVMCLDRDLAAEQAMEMLQ